MTGDAILVLILTGVTLALFAWGRLRVDLVALIMLLALVLTGILDAREALAGFSNTAVVTIAGVFILSASLERTGVAAGVGRMLFRVGGNDERRMVATLMLTAGLLSAFMNNVGVAALLLPVVMEICRRTGISPSRLLIPLSFSCLMGGTLTLIGTPPNLLIDEIVRERGVTSFGMFDFAPIGLPVLVVGTLFFSLFGSRFLPERAKPPVDPSDEGKDLNEIFHPETTLNVCGIPGRSRLDGCTLQDLQIGAAFGVNLLGIVRQRRMLHSPGPDTRVHAGDRLLLEGPLDRLEAHRSWKILKLLDGENGSEGGSDDRQIWTVTVAEGGPLVRRLAGEPGLLGEAELIGGWSPGAGGGSALVSRRLEAGDELIVAAPEAVVEKLRTGGRIEASEAMSSGLIPQIRNLPDEILVARVPAEDPFATSRALSFGVRVAGYVRGDRVKKGAIPLGPPKPGDALLLEGDARSLLRLGGLQELIVEPEGAMELDLLESEQIGFAEAIVSPHGQLTGRSLMDLRFRERYGVAVVAVARGSEVARSDLGSFRLALGDVLLLHGSRERLAELGKNPDFIVLTQTADEARPTGKAGLAVAILAVVVLSVLVGWLPISIAALAGAVVAILSGCMTLEGAYRAVEWKIIVLIGSMLSLGAALQSTGAATTIGETAAQVLGSAGPIALLGALALITALCAQVMPTAAAAIVMAPVALQMATTLDASPRTALLVVAVSASCNFCSPVGHAANILVMGPGRYRFLDYSRVGVPLLVVVLAVILISAWVLGM